MFFHFLIPFLITLCSIQGGPVPMTTFSNMIKLTADDPHHKCPYLRTTKLINPEPDFFVDCTTVEEAQSLNHLKNFKNVQNALCLLYYINFENLCEISNNITNTTSVLLSNSTIEEAWKRPQNILQVCEILKSNFYTDERLKPGINVLENAFHNNRCQRMCTDFEDNVKPICSLTAFMIDSGKKLKQNLISGEPKSDKGAMSKSKPHYTEPNGEIVENSKNQAGNPADQVGALDDKQKVAEVSQISKDTLGGKTQGDLEDNNFDGQGSPHMTTSAGKQVSPNEGPQNVANTEKEISAHEDSKQIDLHVEQGPGEVKPSTESKVPPADNNKQSGVNQQTNIDYAMQDEFDPAELPKPVSSTVQSRPNGNNEPQLETVDKSELKPNEGPEASKTVNGDNNQSEKPIAQGKIPDVSLPQILDNNQNSIQNDVRKNEGEEDAQKKPSSQENNQQKEAAPKNSQQVEEHEAADGKLPSKVDGSEPAGEAPPQFDDDDIGIEPENEGDTDYNNGNEVQPIPSEVKTKLAEKFKPLETNEDGSSFAANYQNQNIDDSESYFFSYFMMVCIMFICGYVAYHNKQKILALVVEGRRGRRPSRTRRPNSANYRKLDSNLEEAVTSSCNKNATQDPLIKG